MEAYRRILCGPPFPSMGKGRDRGARGPIKLITPTFVLPRQGEGIGELVAFLISRALAQPQPQFSKEIAKHALSNVEGSTKFESIKNEAFVSFVRFVVNRMNSNIVRFIVRSLALGFCVGALANFAFAQDLQRLRYGTTNSIMNLPVWVAQDARLFSKHGLNNVEIIFIQSGTLITMGVISGELNFSGAGAASVVAARLKGGDVTLLACPVDADAVYLIARPGINSAGELRGKTAAVTRLGSTTHFYLRSALRYAGLDPQKDVKVLQLGLDFSGALEAGQIDAAALPFNLALPYLQKGWPVLLDLSKTDFVYPASCVVSSQAFIKERPRVVDGFLRAYVESIRLIKRDRQFTEKVFTKWLRQPDPEIAKRTIQVYADLFKRVPTVTDGGIKAVLEELAESSPVPREMMNRPDYFRDPDPLQNLVKEGWIEQLYR